MIRLAIYDKPVPRDFLGVKRIGNHSVDRSIHGYAVAWVAKQHAPKDTEIYLYSDYKSGGLDAFLYWCIDNKIDVINISKGIPYNKDSKRDIVLQKALDAGIIICAGAGNRGESGNVYWPANDPRVIAVGAYNSKTKNVAGYSTIGPEIDIIAQGDWNIPSLSGRIVPLYGTSFASPVIAGYAARWKKLYHNGTRDEFRQFLRDNAKDLGLQGKDPASGWGLFVWPERGSEKVRTFKSYTVEQIKQFLEQFKFTRQIKEIHIHHTWKPTKKDYVGEKTIWAIWNYHVNTLGWRDIGQNFTVSPDGLIWLSRDLNDDPASIKGRNRGAIAIEMIGNFDKGYDVLEGKQREAVVQLVRALLDVTGKTTRDIVFHREYAPKTCPGTSIDKKEFIGWVEAWQRVEKGKAKVKTVVADVAPFTVNIPELGGDRTVMEVRVLIEDVLGGKIVSWDGKTQTFVALVGGKKITVQIGNKEIKVEEGN